MKKISLLLTLSILILSIPAFSAEQKPVSPIKDNYVSISANTQKLFSN
jgi:hypothetical protein